MRSATLGTTEAAPLRALGLRCALVLALLAGAAGCRASNGSGTRGPDPHPKQTVVASAEDNYRRAAAPLHQQPSPTSSAPANHEARSVAPAAVSRACSGGGGDTCTIRPPRSLLFIGNSLTAGVIAIPTLVDLLANDASFPDPDVQWSTDGGETLAGHVARPTTRALLQKAWDVVVLQEASSRTTHLGDRALFNKAAAELASAAQASSPRVRVILYETWAYAHPGSWVYPHYFPSFAAMQAEIRESYREAAESYIRSHTEPSLRVEVAPVGDAWERHVSEASPIVLHSHDSLHSTDEGKYLAALVLYSTIYGRPAAGRSAWKLEPRDAERLQRVADAVTRAR